jgi:hypothetical protein
MDDFVRWNRRIVSAKSLIVSIEGVPYQGFTALDYSDKLDRALVWDGKRDGTPIGKTSGKYTPNACSITFLNDVFRKKFIVQLGLLATAQLEPGAIGMAEWTITVQHVEPGQVPTTDIISGCNLSETKDSYQEGTDALLTECSFQPLAIMRNGLTLFSQARGLL